MNKFNQIDVNLSFQEIYFVLAKVDLIRQV